MLNVSNLWQGNQSRRATVESYPELIHNSQFLSSASIKNTRPYWEIAFKLFLNFMIKKMFICKSKVAGNISNFLLRFERFIANNECGMGNLICSWCRDFNKSGCSVKGEAVAIFYTIHSGGKKYKWKKCTVFSLRNDEKIISF